MSLKKFREPSDRVEGEVSVAAVPVWANELEILFLIKFGVCLEVISVVLRWSNRTHSLSGGRGMAFGRGRGMVRDAKGPDWDCSGHHSQYCMRCILNPALEAFISLVLYQRLIHLLILILLLISWISGCGNVNWCWRATCNKCNTAKPASLVTVDEVRDGRGGGFNERYNYPIRTQKWSLTNLSPLITASSNINDQTTKSFSRDHWGWRRRIRRFWTENRCAIIFTLSALSNEYIWMIWHSTPLYKDFFWKYSE